MTTVKALAIQEYGREQVDLIKNTVAVGASDNELKLFLYQAQKRGLDPLTRQIHFIKRKQYNPDTQKYTEVGTIQTGIDGFRLIADRTGKLSGIKRGTIKDDKGNLLGAWAEIYRTDWKEPAREEVSFNEYCQKKQDGTPRNLWATMPETMIKKVAEAAALRMAFPEDLSGIYTHDEMQQADSELKVTVDRPVANTPIQQSRVIPVPEVEAEVQQIYGAPEGEEMITQKQLGMLVRQMKEKGLTPEAMKAQMMVSFSKEKSDQLTKREASQFIQSIMEGKLSIETGN